MRWQDFVPIISPFVTFLLGIISGGYVIPRLTTKRKLLDWAILDESDLFPKELTAALGVPVRVLVGGGEQDSLSRVQVRLGGGGTEIIENTTAVVRFNMGCRILNARPTAELGEFSKHVRWSSEEHCCRVELDFLNPRQLLDFEFLQSGYEPAAVEVDAAAAGLEVRRREGGRWEMPTSLLQGPEFDGRPLRSERGTDAQHCRGTAWTTPPTTGGSTTGRIPRPVGSTFGNRSPRVAGGIRCY